MLNVFGAMEHMVSLERYTKYLSNYSNRERPPLSRERPQKFGEYSRRKIGSGERPKKRTRGPPKLDEMAPKLQPPCRGLHIAGERGLH